MKSWRKCPIRSGKAALPFMLKWYDHLVWVKIFVSSGQIKIFILTLYAGPTSTNYFSVCSSHSKKLLIQKSTNTHSLDLACQSQYLDLCKSSFISLGCQFCFIEMGDANMGGTVFPVHYTNFGLSIKRFIF